MTTRSDTPIRAWHGDRDALTMRIAMGAASALMLGLLLIPLLALTLRGAGRLASLRATL